MSVNTPPPPRKPGKGEPPNIEATKANLDKPEPAEMTNLNFRVSAEFKRDFKIESARRGCSQVDLLQQVFRYWQERNG